MELVVLGEKNGAVCSCGFFYQVITCLVDGFPFPDFFFHSMECFYTSVLPHSQKKVDDDMISQWIEFQLLFPISRQLK